MTNRKRVLTSLPTPCILDPSSQTFFATAASYMVRKKKYLAAMECLFEKAFASVFAAIERTLGKLLLKNIQQVRVFLLTT